MKKVLFTVLAVICFSSASQAESADESIYKALQAPETAPRSDDDIVVSIADEVVTVKSIGGFECKKTYYTSSDRESYECSFSSLVSEYDHQAIYAALRVNVRRVSRTKVVKEVEHFRCERSGRRGSYVYVCMM